MHRHISIRGRVRPSVHPSVGPSVRPVLFSKVIRTHTRRILCRVSGLVTSKYSILLFQRHFSSKSMVDPRPLKILILHRKRKIQKSKNMAAWQIQFLRPPCFWKCKIVRIFLDLKFSMRAMFFSKIVKSNILNKDNSINNNFFGLKFPTLVGYLPLNIQFWNMTFRPNLNAFSGDEN